ncbi:MAG: hypothetical protein HY553_22725 [Elusimicrobia bacterium]|nr:hypothetical protein [Elusimicrobiota bacterium]
MERRRIAVALALAAVLPAAGQAQTRFVAPVLPGVIGLPPAPVTGPAMTLSPSVMAVSPIVTPKMTMTASPLKLAPVVGLSRPAAGALAGGAKAESPAAAAVSARGRLQGLAASVTSKPGVTTQDADVNLNRFWNAGAKAAAEPEFFLFGGGRLDPRINSALQTVSRSRVGLDIYNAIYQKHGGDLELRVDTDYRATYDARLAYEGGKPVIHVTDNMLRRESPEFVASRIVREMTHDYFDAFPASVELEYLANSAMVRTYAETTGSNSRWWNTRLDRWEEGAYATQRFFGSWREAVVDYYGRGRPVQDSPFFRWIDGNGKSLQELYNERKIDYDTFRQMSDYFQQMVSSESRWVRNNDSRSNP